MDQLKEFLGLIKRQHFWFLAPLLVVLGVAGGMMASKKLTKEFNDFESAVNGYKTKMQGVTSKNQHPNEHFHTGMEELITDRRSNVRDAWQIKWERQKDQLKWPEKLPADFRQRVEQMRPIEKVDPNNVIPRSLLAAYGGYIEKELPRLAAEIGAVWAPVQRRAQSFRGFRRREPAGRNNKNDAVDESQIVIWNPENQALIKERFDWGSSAPKTFEVLYAQEDLWVLASLIDIIKKTNAGAKTHSQARVKEIDFIQIAQDVQDPGFHVIVPKPIGEGDASDDDLPPSRATSPASHTSGNGNQYSTGTETEGNDALAKLVANRYVTRDYAPIADLESLRTEVTVAKRIPVRMRLLMDQRHLYRLLVECANANLTFEVRQFRFNPHDEMEGNGMRLPRGGGGDGEFGGGSNVVKLDDYRSFDRTVELFGIVYIFNPVDDTVLGVEQDATDNLVTQR